MMNNLKLLLLALPFILIAACKKVQKDVHDYYPKVEMISAVVQQDGSIKATGHLLSQGAGDLLSVGFCMDTAPHPDMLSSQKVGKDLSGNTFSATYSGLSTTATYYIRSWAVNENGYAYGNEIAVSSPSFDTSIIPCHLSHNTLELESYGNTNAESFYRVESVDASSQGYRFTATTGNHELMFNFSREPTTGVYTTAHDLPSLREDQFFVNILCVGGSISGHEVLSGYKVYVNQIGPGVIEVFMCSAKVGNGSNTLISARLTSPR